MSSNIRALSYDANGNTLSDGVRAYQWHAGNRLRSVSVDGTLYEWEYDGLSSRVLEKRNGTVWKRFGWEGASLVQERDAANRVVRTYYGNGDEEGGRTYVYAKDHLGSVREVLDATAAVVGRYEYDFWGRPLRQALGH